MAVDPHHPQNEADLPSDSAPEAESPDELEQVAPAEVWRPYLGDLRRQLETPAERARQEGGLAALAAKHECLAAFGSVAALIATFKDAEEVEANWPVVDAALSRLIAENFASPGGPVGSLLVRLCLPLIQGVSARRRWRYPREEYDELDAR